ncbi:DUF4307 domain-containing protein [Sinomonas sp. R1AF57]|uniref:DUF4307 domain-containing protein n=1 Tax=Sinomonas sp. R1AF57 TaxID=2020377 RepID=UPI0021009094|nr:DUF4307 domain-containing protein [Sinomonas sp. R1AF57]
MSQTPTLASRYGTPRRGLPKRTARILVVVALVVGIAVAGWLTVLSTTRNAVTSKDIGFRTPDAWHAELDFAVTKDASASAVCAVKALSETYAVVGYREVAIGPDRSATGTTTSSTTAALRTESAAVSAMVDSCWLTSR